MKQKEKYSALKSKYNDYVILIKSGSFYITFDIDALILNKIFRYQVVNNKVGFPINSINKIVSELKKSSINYIIENNDDILKFEFYQNEYINVFCEIQKSNFQNNLNDLLIQQIRKLLEIDSDNYNKIRRFIDEF